MARHQPPALDGLERRPLLGAIGLGIAAARAERAARWRIDRRGNFPLQRIDIALSRQLRIGDRHRRQQRLRIGMLAASLVDLVARRQLDDAPEIEHQDAVRHMPHHARDCGEMKISVSPNSSLSSLSRLRICAWIDTSSAETGSSQTISLGSVISARAMPMRCALPAREFVRIAVDHFGQQAHRFHHLEHARLPLVLVQLRPQRAQRLGDDLAHRHARIERGQRVLEDDLQVAAVAARISSARQLGQILRPARAPAPRRARAIAGCSGPSVDLPQPLSPTMPSVSPLRMVETDIRRAPSASAAAQNRPPPRSRRSS